MIACAVGRKMSQCPSVISLNPTKAAVVTSTPAANPPKSLISAVRPVVQRLTNQPASTPATVKIAMIWELRASAKKKPAEMVRIHRLRPEPAINRQAAPAIR